MAIEFLAIGVTEAVAKKLSQTHDPRQVIIVASAAADNDKSAEGTSGFDMRPRIWYNIRVQQGYCE